MHPRELPKLRAQTVQRIAALNLDDGESPAMGPAEDDTVRRMLAHLRNAELYWISDDMTALAMHAGQSLAAARWATVDRPSPVGLAVFDGGLGMVDISAGLSAPVHALAWGPGPDHTMIVWHLMRGDRFFAGLPAPLPGRRPPFVVVREARLPVTEDPIALDDLPAHEGMRPSRPIVAALAASWNLMQQPQLAETARQEPKKVEARALRRASMPTFGVTLVALRRQFQPANRESGVDTDGRHYRRRWVVSGHWRSQPHGPDRSLRRQQWIPSHVKGPDGAPLMSTERVNVWRR